MVMEGKSSCDLKTEEPTLQCDVMRIKECTTVLSISSECCELRQVYSLVHFIITTSHDQFTRIIIILELECIITKLSCSQFRQI